VYQVLQPVTDENSFAERGKEIVAAALELGMSIDTQGFLLAWVNGTRVLVERDAAGKIIALAFVAVGRRWIKDDFTATILELRGHDQPAMLEFIKQIAAALGATSLFFQPEDPVEEDGRRVHRVYEMKLQ
jgi:hypothetical protein